MYVTCVLNILYALVNALLPFFIFIFFKLPLHPNHNSTKWKEIQLRQILLNTVLGQHYLKNRKDIRKR